MSDFPYMPVGFPGLPPIPREDIPESGIEAGDSSARIRVLKAKVRDLEAEVNAAEVLGAEKALRWAIREGAHGRTEDDTQESWIQRGLRAVGGEVKP